MTIRVETAEGVFAVFDATGPDADPAQPTPYAAFWLDFATNEIFFFDALLYEPGDVGWAIRLLERDIIDRAAVSEWAAREQLTGSLFPPRRGKAHQPINGVWLELDPELLSLLVGFDVPGPPGLRPTSGSVAGGGTPPGDTICHLVLLCVCGSTSRCCPQCDGDCCSPSVCCPPPKVCCGELCCSACCENNCCDSGTVCRTAWCSEAGHCKFTPVNGGEACTDSGLECRSGGLGFCSNGTCIQPPAVDGTECNDDGTVCTSDFCVDGTCVHLPANNGGTCENDSDPCTRSICADGICTHPWGNTGAHCGLGGGFCAVYLCNDGCHLEPRNEGEVCDDDGNPCTTNRCRDGSCTSEPCCGNNPDACPDDGDPCTADYCSQGTCTHPVEPNCTPCPEGWCIEGICEIGIICALLPPQAGAGCPGSTVAMELTGSCQSDCDSMSFSMIKSVQYLTVNLPEPIACDGIGHTAPFTVTIDPDAPLGPLFFQIIGTIGTVECTTSVTVNVYDVGITSPAENDVFLQGGQVEFTADAIPNATYAWSVILGTASPSTGTMQDFITTLLSAGDIEVQLVVTTDGQTCETTRRILAVKPEVVEISFVGDDFSLKKWATDDTGAPIVDPVWVKTLGGAVSKDEPAAYKRSAGSTNSNMTADVKLAATTPLTSLTTMQIRGGGIEQFTGQPAGISVTIWPSAAFQLTSTAIADSNGVYDPLDISWEYIVQRIDGTWPSWTSAVAMNMTSHRIYRTFDAPLTTPVFDLALQKICLEYASGQTTVSAIASAANSGIDVDLCYDPGSLMPFDPNNLGTVLNAYTTGSCLCWHNALLLQLLAQTTGIDGDVRFFYGGVDLGFGAIFEYPPQNYYATLRVDTPGHDLAGAQPHFRYHVQTLIDGTYYDPSYGTTGRAASLHQCMEIGAQLLESTSLPGVPNWFFCGWTDPHGPDPLGPGCVP